MEPKSVNMSHLTACQHDATAGLYSQTLAGFLHWVAPQYEEIQQGLNKEIMDLREEVSLAHVHPRTPDILANLGVGLRYFLSFAEYQRYTDSGSLGTWVEGTSSCGKGSTKYPSRYEPCGAGV